jgi:hypothetical protein
MRRQLAIAIGGTRRLARSEDGFAVPFVMLLMIAAFAMVSVGVVASVRAQQGTTRDKGSKVALAAAEAGVNQALLHYNRIVTTEPNTCLVHTGGSTFAEAPQSSGPGSGWCRAVSGTVDAGSFTYSVRPSAGMIEIVATGTSVGATRRVHVTAHSSSGRAIFSLSTLLAQNSLTLSSFADINASVSTNGDITMASNARICGDASHGVGRDVYMESNAVHACGTELEKALNLPPVNQGDAPTVNDNDRFFTLDPISGNPNRVDWDPATRELAIHSNASVTLGGAVYSFCKLSLSSNSNLFVAEGATVLIYFDSPETCGLTAGESQLQLDANSVITSNVTGGPTNLAMLFVGSPTMATSIDLLSNTQADGACEQNYVIYAPRTDIIFNSNARYCGAVGGKTIAVESEAEFYSDNAALTWELPNTAAHYVIDRFVECDSAPAADPDAEC